jgi:hypothetical protein
MVSPQIFDHYGRVRCIGIFHLKINNLYISGFDDGVNWGQFARVSEAFRM